MTNLRLHSARALIAFALILVQIATLAIPDAAAWAAAPASDAPVPISFPRDDGPHDAPIEWWYFTGHLFTPAGDRYGFEFVVFKAQQAGLTGYASHFAITDDRRGAFHYDQRLGFAPAGANDESNSGFDLVAVDWRMRGVDGTDHLRASMPGYAIDLTLTSTKPPVLHDADGYIDYGDDGASYYYSRTRIEVAGTLTVAGQELAVTGESWFDHQWGAFTTVETGGWDWYAIQLDDDTELMLNVIRSTDGAPSLIDGSFVAADGTLTVLDGVDFTVTEHGTWTSPLSGATYSSGWTVVVPRFGIELELTPTLIDQELDTRLSTGVIYWEGQVTVSGNRDGRPLTGLGYVELTGRSPVETAGATLR